MTHYLYILLVLAVGILGIWIFVAHARKHPVERPLRFKWSYLLVVPFLRDLLQAEVTTRMARGGALLTAREVLGWGVIFVLVVGAVLLGREGITSIVTKLFE